MTTSEVWRRDDAVQDLTVIDRIEHDVNVPENQKKWKHEMTEKGETIRNQHEIKLSINATHLKNLIIHLSSVFLSSRRCVSAKISGTLALGTAR